MALAATIKQRALEIGFDLAGIASASALQDFRFLPQWLKKGYAGEMHYLNDPRREDPRRVLPSVKSVICVGLIYNSPYPYSTEVHGAKSAPENSTAPGDVPAAAPPRGWISRYAWGKDYHKIMRKRLEQLRAVLQQQAPGVETRVYTDTGPILEREFARLAGAGWVGKNTCLINQGQGSWFFLGVVLTNLALEPDLPAPDRCGTCTRCLEACPTGALVEPYVMDASRCIAYFNIELRGAIPPEFRAAIGQNVFGCDICQDVCPWNRRPLSLVPGPSPVAERPDEPWGAKIRKTGAATTDLAEFQPLKVAPAAPDASTGLKTHDAPTGRAAFSLFNPTLESLASLTEEDFRQLFAHSPIKRAKYRGWLRNLCVVMGNSGDRRFIPWLEEAAQHSDEMVRGHALWALARISSAA